MAKAPPLLGIVGRCGQRSFCYSRRKGGAGRGFKAKNVVPTLNQRRTNVVPTFFKRCTNVFKTFLKRRYNVFPKRGTLLARRAKNEVLVFRIAFGEATYAKDAFSRIGGFASPAARHPCPAPRGPRIPEENDEIARKPETGKNEIKTEKKNRRNNEQGDKTKRRES